MDRIKKLWSVMEKSERRAFKAFLEVSKSGHGADKQLALLKMIQDHPDIDQHAAALKLYKNKGSKAFIMMKGRLYERMVEFAGMIAKPAPVESDEVAPYMAGLLECRRHMVLATVLGNRNLADLMMEHLLKALELARNCQNPEMELDILVRIRANYKYSPTGFDVLTEQIQEALEKTSRDAHALGIYQGFFIRHSQQESEPEAILEYLDQHVPELELRLQQRYSARADFYTQLLQSIRQKTKRNFPAAREALLKMLALQDAYPGIRSNVRRAESYFQLGILELRDLHFDLAKDYFERARPFLNPKSPPYFAATTMLATALLHLGDLDRAESECAAMDEVRDSATFVAHFSLVGVHTYTKACIAFQKGKYREALRLVHSIDDLTADKAGWGTGLRIFEVMIYVEMEEMEVAESKLEPLRKHTERHPCSEREILIYKLLRGQGKHFFSFDPFPEEVALLDALAEKGSWDPIGKEVVRVDRWYIHKQYSLGLEG